MPTLDVQKVPRVDDRSLPIFAEFDRLADRIRLEASVTATPTDEQTKVRWSEFRGNDVFRRVEPPVAVDIEKITARLKNGLLEIVAPQQAEAAAASPKPIKVAASS